MMKSIFWTFFLLLLVLTPLVHAQEDLQENLSQQAANPLADLMSFPFQNNLNINNGEFNRNTNILNIQPVIPFADGRIITRTIFPIVRIPDYSSEEGETGLGVERYRLYRLLFSSRKILHLGCRSGAGTANGR
jgi:hypothetical protein